MPRLFLGVNLMNSKWISVILVGVTSILAVLFIFLNKLELAMLSMTIMFALTNTFRARNFKAQGFEREARWMNIMAIFFAIASVLVLYIVVT